MVGLRGMPNESFFFFFSPFSFPESCPEVSADLSFLLGLPSGDVKLLRFVEGFSAKNYKQNTTNVSHPTMSKIFLDWKLIQQNKMGKLPCEGREESHWIYWAG